MLRNEYKMPEGMQKKKRKRRLSGINNRLNNRLKTQLNDRLHDCRGTTLTELIAAMALDSLIMAAALFFLLQCLRIHHRILPYTAAISLSESLLDQIESVLADADPEAEIVICSKGTYPSVTFSDRHHRMAVISRTEDGKYLCTEYLDLEDPDEDTGKTRWILGQDLYQGFEVSELSFVFLKQENPAVRMLQAELTIMYRATGFSYSSVRFIPCGIRCSR